MAVDRTLPRQFAAFSGRYGAPVAAVRLTGITVLVVLIAVPNVAAAGAVSSLIFLGTFALVHGIAYLARKRAITSSPFRTLWFPLVPVVGGGLCLVLSLFQAVAVPSAGVLAALWLSLGAILFVTFLGPRAKAVDAAAEAFDPEILRLRGKRPLILVPIANPASAATLVTMAGALAPSFGFPCSTPFSGQSVRPA